jgi:putative DNA primase/helicase
LEPTKDGAFAALKELKEPIEGFSFVKPEDLSVALSAILTGRIRTALPTAPLHGYSAPVAGSGKSKLVDYNSNIETGHDAPVMSQGKNEEEMEKRLGSELLAGNRLISIDNCDEPLGGQLLCQMLTQQMVKVRILGKTLIPERPAAPNLV